MIVYQMEWMHSPLACLVDYNIYGNVIVISMV